MHTHSRVMAAAIAVMSLCATAAPAQDFCYVACQAPVGNGYFAQVEALWLKRDESDATTLATLNSAGNPGRLATLVSEDVGFDFETGFRVRAGMMLNSRTQVEVEYFGVRHKATVQREPLFDPEMTRLKG